MGTQALENDLLQVLVVCMGARPEVLTRHLLLLAHSRQVKICAVPGLSEHIGRFTGLKSSAVLGVRRAAAGDTAAEPAPAVEALSKFLLVSRRCRCCRGALQGAGACLQQHSLLILAHAHTHT